MDDLPDLGDGFTDDQRRILNALARASGSGTRTIRSDRLLARALDDSVPSFEGELITDAWRAPRDRHLAAYRTLVQLAQPFTTRYPLVIGTGNFGTRDNETPADAVFTRCRLSALGAAALAGTVPHLLINGAVTRAAGPTVGCVPHNLGEVITAARGLLEQPKRSDDELIDSVPGPDFPTGGVLESQSAVRAIYRTGVGPLPVRGRATLTASSIGPAVVVSELPFTVGPVAFLGEVTDGLRAGRWPEIADIRDESDQRGLQIVVQARVGANPERLLAKLFEQTCLAVVLDVDMVALVGGVPRRVSLPTLLRAYLRRLTDRGARPAALIDELASVVSRLGDARRTRLPA